MLKKCDLCSAGQAAPNGLLCIACREALIRLFAICEDERSERGGSDLLEEIVMYPEGMKSTLGAGS